MLEEKDYFMRIVHETVRMLMKLVFNKDLDHVEDEKISPELYQIYKKLISMVDDGEINEAENILADHLDPENKACFEMALLFYEKINAKTDEFLEEHDYSKQEIIDGIKYVVDYYGCGSLLEAFLDEESLK